MQVQQQFDVGIAFPGCNFLKNHNPAQVFSCDTCEFFQPVILLKARPHHRWFFVNFETFFSPQLIKNNTLAQLFYCQFLEFFQALNLLNTGKSSAGVFL